MPPSHGLTGFVAIKPVAKPEAQDDAEDWACMQLRQIARGLLGGRCGLGGCGLKGGCFARYFLGSEMG